MQFASNIHYEMSAFSTDTQHWDNGHGVCFTAFHINSPNDKDGPWPIHVRYMFKDGAKDKPEPYKWEDRDNEQDWGFLCEKHGRCCTMVWDYSHQH